MSIYQIVNSQPGIIKFADENHKYTVDDVVYTSVTTVIKSYFKPFNAEKVSSEIAENGEYTQQELLNNWKMAGASGTVLHADIEYYLLNGKQPVPCHPDFYRFLKFWYDKKFTTSTFTWYPEYRVYDSDSLIAGTIDCLLCNPDGDFIILDWKRSKNIRMESYDGLYGKPPYDTMQDCNYSHYSLQLNYYRAILQKKYNVKRCLGMFLIVFKPGLHDYKIVNVNTININL